MLDAPDRAKIRVLIVAPVRIWCTLGSFLCWEERLKPEALISKAESSGIAWSGMKANYSNFSIAIHFHLTKHWKNLHTKVCFTIHMQNTEKSKHYLRNLLILLTYFSSKIIFFFSENKNFLLLCKWATWLRNQILPRSYLVIFACGRRRWLPVRIRVDSRAKHLEVNICPFIHKNITCFKHAHSMWVI